MIENEGDGRPRWKTAVDAVAIAWPVGACLPPCLMLPQVSVLPYVQTHALGTRIVVVALGDMVVVAILAALEGRRWAAAAVRPAPTGSRWRAASHWIGAGLGIAMFTVVDGWLGANSLGLLASALPSEPYRDTVLPVSLENDGQGARRVGRQREAMSRLVFQRRGDTRRQAVTVPAAWWPRGGPPAPGVIFVVEGRSGPAGIMLQGVSAR